MMFAKHVNINCVSTGYVNIHIPINILRLNIFEHGAWSWINLWKISRKLRRADIAQKQSAQTTDDLRRCVCKTAISKLGEAENVPPRN